MGRISNLLLLHIGEDTVEYPEYGKTHSAEKCEFEDGF